MLNRKHLIFSIVSLTAYLIIGVGAFNAFAEWPDRPVEMIVPYSAGGGTDATGRIIAKMLEDEYKVPFKVVNRTGGGGVVGHKAIAGADPDGYTIGLATFSLTTYEWFKSSDVTYRDFTPIALFNVDATTILVNSKSEFKTLKALLDAIKNNPGKYNVATPVGAGHHLAFSNLLDAYGIDPNSVVVVPVKGGAMILQELAAGGVEIGPSTLPEARALIDAGKVRPLAILSPTRSNLYPDVPTGKEAVGIDIEGGTWRSIVGPKGLPQPIVDKLSASIKRIYESAEFQEIMNKRGYGLRYLKGEDLEVFMANMHEANGRILKKLGLAK
jgi:tripartite-type tricarboxylate transporter receptor subunit TctC